MNLQVKPPPAHDPGGIPLGCFSLAAVVIIFLWVWSELSLASIGDIVSFALAAASGAIAYFAAFRALNRVPVLLQALAFALIGAIAVFRLVVTHEHSDADALGGAFMGIMIFVLVAMDQYQIKRD